jgi:hypothetical protein
MRCSTEPQEKAAYAAAPAPRFSTHLAFSKPLKNQAFSAQASKGEYKYIAPVRNHRFYMRKQRNETKEGGWFLSTKRR